MRLLLASKSPARLTTLLNAGITPIVRVAGVDEPRVLRELEEARGATPSPATQVSALATAKRDAITAELARPASLIDEDGADELLVIGCDSMLEIGGRMLGKPRTPEVARARIRRMRSSRATLWTGHALARMAIAASGDSYTTIGAVERSASTRILFSDMSDEEIDAYVESEEPLRVAGSFTIDGLGGPFITGVEGDHHSVVGISLPLLREMARDLGVFWPDLWDWRRSANAASVLSPSNVK